MLRFNTRQVYKQLRSQDIQVPWFRIFCGNTARPRALITLWIACHGKLPTRSRLCRFGIVNYATCCFCLKDETIDHILFECKDTRQIWQKVLDWLGVPHDPKPWSDELCWLIQQCKGKSVRAAMLKLALAETVYGVWQFRNSISFRKEMDAARVVSNILDVIVYRSWASLKLRPHVAQLMI
ncbi:uncharacterized protein LOC131596827 [Vicia villosa]|uniref:uncharacterized protein LOC131596827 n=1 Tax=Vicia villosa TaxID=3911 RepID=UPI00273B1569|nr:uncharacterized protein LOC131596827 [Vicia villosa]